MADWHEIYDFWFGAPDSDDHGNARKFWFVSGPSVDREIRDRFLGLYERAVDGELANWKSQARSGVSLVVLLDQFPRNIFRGDRRSFAADPLALETARELVDGPLHDELITVEKAFAYLPFEHSENLDDQEKCVALFHALEPHDAKDEWLDFAIQHRDIVREFGRFPHRNAILGRRNTPAEDAWLASNDQRFGTGGKTGDETGGKDKDR